MAKNSRRDEPAQRTLMRKLRDELGWSRQQMADALGISDASMEKYEAVLTKELALRALQIAQEHRIDYLVPDIQELAGVEVADKLPDLADVTPAEAQFLYKCLRIMRSPKTPMQSGVPTFIDEISRQGG